MANQTDYTVKAFDWEGKAYPGILSFWLVGGDKAPHLDQKNLYALALPSEQATFDVFQLAGSISIAELGVVNLELQGIEFVSPLGPPLCMVLTATKNPNVSLELFPGDAQFNTVEGPFFADGKVFTLMGMK